VKIDPTKYLLRRLIVEVRHPGNLLHSQKVGAALQELVPEFDQVIQKGGAIPDAIELLSSKTAFRRLICEWSRTHYSEEKLKDVATGMANVKHYVGHAITKLGIEIFDRVGVRMHYILPLNGDYADVLAWYNEMFVKSIEKYAPFGKITDSGVYAFSGTDGKYGFNLTIAPLKKDEYRIKLSEFKQETDVFDNSLLIDFDLFYANRSDSKPIQLIETLMDQSRIKTNQFLEIISQKK